jgi:hypothetical protein
LQRAGLPLPEFVADAGALAGRKLGGLRPWAWAPDSVAQLAPLFGQVTDKTRNPEQCFNSAIAELYSKSWSARFLRRWLESQPEEWLCAPEHVGVAVRSLDEALAAVAAIRARGHHRVVIKQALGLAGQNAIRLWEPPILAAQRHWIERSLGHGGELVIEPWLERAGDFSMQCEMTPRGLQLIGFAGLVCDRAGRFLANWAEPDHRRRVPAAVRAALGAPREVAGRLHPLLTDLRAALGAELARAGFLGPVGVDAFVFRDHDGVCRLKPVVEINPRYTMGRVTLELMQHVAPGSFGCLRLVNRGALRAAGFADFPAFAADVARRAPVVRTGEPVAKIVSGSLVLNEPASAQRACTRPVHQARACNARRPERVPARWPTGRRF